MTVSGVILSHERRHNGVGINYSHYRDVICDCPAPSSSYSARGPFASKYLTKRYFRNTTDFWKIWRFFSSHGGRKNILDYLLIRVRVEISFLTSGFLRRDTIPYLQLRFSLHRCSGNLTPRASRAHTAEVLKDTMSPIVKEVTPLLERKPARKWPIVTAVASVAIVGTLGAILVFSRTNTFQSNSASALGLTPAEVEAQYVAMENAGPDFKYVAHFSILSIPLRHCSPSVRFARAPHARTFFYS